MVKINQQGFSPCILETIVLETINPFVPLLTPHICIILYINNIIAVICPACLLIFII